MTPLRVAACQINPVVGDLDANVARITAAARDAAQRGAQVAVFGEMALTGYPVEDLLLRRSFAVDSREAVHELARSLDAAGCGDLVVVLEAMKMENPVAAHKDGIVTGLAVEPGTAVTQGTVLLEIKSDEA